MPRRPDGALAQEGLQDQPLSEDALERLPASKERRQRANLLIAFQNIGKRHSLT